MYDELIKALHDGAEFLECSTPGIKNSFAKMCHNAADAVEELSKTRWIPVTERLPKADEYDARSYAVPYLVMNGWMRVTARRTNDYWVLFGEGTVLEYVTHWMPLPEPPVEKVSMADG